MVDYQVPDSTSLFSDSAHPSVKDLLDTLIAACLSTSFHDRTNLEEAIRCLANIEQHPDLQPYPDERGRIHDVRQSAERVARSKRPTRKAFDALCASIEGLPDVLREVIAAAASASAGDRSAGPRPLELPPEVDEPLFNDFLSNAELNLSDLEQDIERLRLDSADALAEVKRRVHTLKGESGMLGLSDLERVLHLSESFLEQPVPPWDRADRMLLVCDWVRDALLAYAQYRHPSTAVENIQATLETSQGQPSASGQTSSLLSSELEPEPEDPSEARVAAAPVPSVLAAAASAPMDAAAHPHAIRAPEPTAHLSVNIPVSPIAPSETSLPSEEASPWSEDDEEIVNEFLTEVEEHLGAVDQTLIDIEETGLDPERINRLFRAFHTLKGVASFLHLRQFADLTHLAETMLDRVRSGQPLPAACAVDLTFDATALLRELAKLVEESLVSRKAVPVHDGVESLSARIRDAIEGRDAGCDRMVEGALPGERLGEILVRNGVVEDEHVTHALSVHEHTGLKIGQALVKSARVPPKAVAHALRAQKVAHTNAALKNLVKVDLERVDNLVEAIGELVIVESMISNAPEVSQLPLHLRNYLGQFAKITRELQELGMRMRMVPLRTQFQKMTRIVRDLAHRGNKQAHVVLAGEGTEMDRVMVEQLADPLVHLIRNAVDHGIEPAKERAAAGKPETGTVRLSACHEGGSIVIEIADDGRGIDRDGVLSKAISLGIVEKNANLSDSQVFDLIFAPGFSTAHEVTEVSGRGVGLDVVKRNIEAVRGRIITTSTPGQGTTFRLVLPLTLAIIDGMVIRCGHERFILPTLNIVESLQPQSEMLFSISGSHEQILVRGHTFPLVRLNRVLDVSGGETDPQKGLVIIVESLRTRIALMVDEVVMKQQVVIKTLNKDLDSSRLFAGAAILSNGRVGLILNVESLIDASRRTPVGKRELTQPPSSPEAELLN